MNNDNNDHILMTLFFTGYWFIGGFCLTIATPWPWSAYCGLAAAFFAVIGFAIFKQQETRFGKGPGWLGLLLFIPPLTMAIVGKALIITLWLG